MSNRIDIDSFLGEMGNHAVIDVRSPAEFQRGHIPSAINVPLFDDQERARIGTLYKDQGRDEAVLTGLEIVGPKMRWLVEETQRAAANRDILVHCWRGGMRSASVGWLLEQAGMAPKVLNGGYKAFRRQAHAAFDADWTMLILSGMTGAGKTPLLYEIAALGEQLVDLEGLAHHRGSSFGGIGLPDQPTCEQFENNLFLRLRELDSELPIWLEDESASIGKVRVPDAFWGRMRQSPAIFIDVDRGRRAKNLVVEYGKLDQQLLIEATQRLEKKLGGLRTQEAIALLEQNDMEAVALRLLEYYDKTYRHAADKRPRDEVHLLSGKLTAERIIEFGRTLEVTLT